MWTEIDPNESEINLNESEINLNESEIDLNESEIDPNESEIDLNEYEYFREPESEPESIWDRSRSWINISTNGIRIIHAEDAKQYSIV